jgi:hypothetical protein
LRPTDPNRSKFALHGPAIEIACEVPDMTGQVQRLFEPFAVQRWPDGFLPTVGIIRPYTQSEVLRHLSPGARPVTGVPADVMEVYEDGDRFWLVDDRWGMAEINLIRGQFRSWIVPKCRLDPVRIAETAIVWPLAQLLRAKGLYLLPSVSVVRDGFAVMIVCPFTLEAELVAMIRAGYKVIGQRWTCLREEEGRLALLHLPGMIERSFVPRLRAASTENARATGSGSGADRAWVDLSSEYLGSWQNHAFCDAVLIADGGRRGTARLRDVEPSGALEALRSAWPLVELHPQRRHGHLPRKLAQHTRGCELQLSRSPAELLDLLATLRTTPVGKLPDQNDSDAAMTPWAGLRPLPGIAA